MNIDWFTNLLKGSPLWTTVLFGHSGWFWLAIGVGIAVVLLIAGIVLYIVTRFVVSFILLCLGFLLILVAIAFAWPDLWAWPAIAAVVWLIGLLVGLIAHQRRIGVIIVAIATVLALIFTGLTLSGGLPSLTGSASKPCATSTASAPATHFHNLDEGKSSDGAFGTPVVERDEVGINAVIHTRICEDPALAASLLAEACLIPANLINEYEARFMASRNLWDQAIENIEKFIAVSAFKTQTVPTGTPTLYMAPNDTGTFMDVRSGYTIGDGTNAVYTNPNGCEMRLRLDCGLQPNFDSPPPGLPACVDVTTGGTCQPSCPPEFPHGHPATGCKDDSKVGPHSQGNAPQGGGPAVAGAGSGGPLKTPDQMKQPDQVRIDPVTPTATATPAPVVIVNSDPVITHTADPQTQDVNNGQVLTTGDAGTGCNPVFQDNC